MKWKHREKSVVGKSSNDIERIVWVLSKLEPHMINTVSHTPIFSNEEKEDLVKTFREMKERIVDGYSRLRKTVVYEDVSDSTGWKIDDTSLLVKLEKTEQELQYFVSLGLQTLERLYLTNHLSEEVYLKYRQILRFLPKFHSELVHQLETGKN